MELIAIPWRPWLSANEALRWLLLVPNGLPIQSKQGMGISVEVQQDYTYRHHGQQHAIVGTCSQTANIHTRRSRYRHIDQILRRWFFRCHRQEQLVHVPDIQVTQKWCFCVVAASSEVWRTSSQPISSYAISSTIAAQFQMTWLMTLPDWRFSPYCRRECILLRRLALGFDQITDNR